jgi:hypothetical protein
VNLEAPGDLAIRNRREPKWAEEAADLAAFSSLGAAAIVIGGWIDRARESPPRPPRRNRSACKGLATT